MAAILQYTNFSGERKTKSWNPGPQTFPALIKCYVQEQGKPKLSSIDKPSKRPATYRECCLYAERLKEQYGNKLKQLIIWNIEALNQNSNGYKIGGSHESQ